MNVTKENIDSACDEFAKLVPTASFVSLDLEMTGIHLPDCKELLMDTPSVRYSKMRKVASRFNIVQVGLTMFHRVVSSSTTDDEDAEDKFEARTYNIFTFPSKGQITLDGSAVEFLVKNNMDWNAWFRDGVTYLRKGPAEELHMKMFPPPPTVEDGVVDGGAVAPSNAGDGMVLDKADDIAFCDGALSGVAEWAKNAITVTKLDDNDTQTPNEHVIPSCNSYLRRFLYQELERIYLRPNPTQNDTGTQSSFSIETRTPDPNKHWEKIMVILLLTPEEREAKEAAALAAKQSRYETKLGFRRFWNALTESKRPLVVHNGLFDLLFMCAHMHEDLPTTLHEFKGVVGGLFPGGVFDTRTCGGTVFVPTQDAPNDCGDGKDGSKEPVLPSQRALFPELRLDRVYGVCKTESDAAAVVAVAMNTDEKNTTTTDKECVRLTVKFAEGHDRYEDSSNAILHEAGYDSYITAFSFAYMRLITERQRIKKAELTAMATVEHLADIKYRIPLYRTFYPNVNLTPNSHDTVVKTDGEQQYVFKGFPKEYKTSDVARLFTTAPPSPAEDGKDGGDDDEPKTTPSVSVRWVNDDSVVIRFTNDDAATVLANLKAHTAVHDTSTGQAGNTTLVALNDYMRAADEEVAAMAIATVTEAESDGGEKGIKRAAGSMAVDGPVPLLEIKKARIEQKGNPST